eukprot:14208353-Alexandrium_andersonii.AAC.1
MSRGLHIDDGQTCLNQHSTMMVPVPSRCHPIDLPQHESAHADFWMQLGAVSSKKPAQGVLCARWSAGGRIARA